MYDWLKLYNIRILSLKLLFYEMVKPILLYGCEVGGFGDNEIIERAHLKLCKLLLNLKTSTPSYMVCCELGRYPIELDIKLRIISYWTKLIRGKESKISTIMYHLSYHTYMTENLPLRSIKFTENIFHEYGFSYMEWSTFPARRLVKGSH